MPERNGELRGPFGHFESAVAGIGQIGVTGWTIDPNTSSPIRVHVYVDGRWAAAATADRERPDVGAAFPAYGSAHGFGAVASAYGGPHQVCVYAINTGPGDANPLLGCRWVTLPGGNPGGNFESLAAADSTVTLQGWALDPDTSEPITVEVDVDGASATVAVADASRPDVAARFPGYGPAHGFVVGLPRTAGNHTYCVSAINVGLGTATKQLLGCRSVS